MGCLACYCPGDEHSGAGQTYRDRFLLTQAEQSPYDDADGGEQLKRRLARTFAAQAAMAFEHFADLPPDGRHGIEAGRRLLEDHRHADAAHVTHRVLGQLQQIVAGEAHGAAEIPPGGG